MNVFSFLESRKPVSVFLLPKVVYKVEEFQLLMPNSDDAFHDLRWITRILMSTYMWYWIWYSLDIYGCD